MICPYRLFEAGGVGFEGEFELVLALDKQGHAVLSGVVEWAAKSKVHIIRAEIDVGNWTSTRRLDSRLYEKDTLRLIYSVEMTPAGARRRA